MSDVPELLPGVPEDYVRARLDKAPGKEIKSGKFNNPNSSSALAVNAFAWFHHQPALLPTIPGREVAGWPAKRVDVECCARFPWSGGTHPWLDAFVETSSHIIGVESKRHEPFRDKKVVSLSEAYNRPIWGEAMGPWEAMRDRLRSRDLRFEHLDAAQLVKHAFGLRTEAAFRVHKIPMLVYLYAEPPCWPKDAITRHSDEIATFARQVEGAEVSFTAVSWRDWLATWVVEKSPVLAAHRHKLTERFDL